MHSLKKKYYKASDPLAFSGLVNIQNITKLKREDIEQFLGKSPTYV